MFGCFSMNSKLLKYDLKTHGFDASLRVIHSHPLINTSYLHFPEHWSASNSSVKLTNCESPRSRLGADKTSYSHSSAVMSISTGSSIESMKMSPGQTSSEALSKTLWRQMKISLKTFSILIQRPHIETPGRYHIMLSNCWNKSLKWNKWYFTEEEWWRKTKEGSVKRRDRQRLCQWQMVVLEKNHSDWGINKDHIKINKRKCGNLTKLALTQPLVDNGL